MVHFNAGPTRWDATGWSYGPLCAPFLPVMKSVGSAERFYTSGEDPSSEFNLQDGTN